MGLWSGQKLSKDVMWSSVTTLLSVTCLYTTEAPPPATIVQIRPL